MADTPIPAYFDGYNADLLAVIPPDAKAILEVGCGAGKLAEMHRRVNPQVRWTGFEIHAAAALHARDSGRIDEVLIENVEETGKTGWPPRVEPADCLILGDVLEHLRDPWAVLRGLTSVVKPGGQVLASIPNVAHYSVILGLLKGEWRYQDEGLLDRTHLRFFALEGIRELFKQAGLEIFEVRGRKCCFDPKTWEEFERQCPTEASHEPDRHKVYQWVVRARKPTGVMITGFDVVKGVYEKPQDEPRKLHIHAVTAEHCCARVRIREPFAALATIPGVKCTTHAIQGGPTANPVPDIYIQQRWRGASVDYQRRFLDAGSLLIAEIDDDPRGLEGIPESDFMPLRAVHAVQCSTEAIAEVVRPYNPHVAVIPNQIADLPPWRERDPDDGIAIFYGAQNREPSWAPIMPAINRVLADHPNVMIKVVHDRLFYDAIESKLKQFYPFLAYEDYRIVLRSADIALLPLEDHPFNRCKSDLKFLECAAEGVMVITTPWGPAEESTPYARQEQRALLYEYPHEFEDSLRAVIADADYRTRFARNAYAYVRDHRRWGQHYRKQYEWYLSMLNRQSELDRSLRERVPELDR